LFISWDLKCEYMLAKFYRLLPSSWLLYPLASPLYGVKTKLAGKNEKRPESGNRCTHCTGTMQRMDVPSLCSKLSIQIDGQAAAAPRFGSALPLSYSHRWFLTRVSQQWHPSFTRRVNSMRQMPRKNVWWTTRDTPKLFSFKLTCSEESTRCCQD
jgi:hypothetical protein